MGKNLYFLVLCVFMLSAMPRAYSQGSISVSDAPATPTAKTLYKDNILSAWVNFDGTSCSGGAGANECTIGSKFNILKVVRTGTGLYEVYFATPFASTNYVVAGSAQPAYLELGVVNTNKVEIVFNHHSTHLRHNVTKANMMVIGPQ
jgi:hypothetical protein